MAQTFTCPEGHHWQLPAGHSLMTLDESISCPICGSPGTTTDTKVTAEPEATALSDLATEIGAGASLLDHAEGIATVPHGAGSPEPGTPSFRLPEVPGYEILEVLGRGGMGVVYKARQLSLKRLVALKMLVAGPHASPDLLARFRTEAEAVARLQHPHIVPIYEVGQANGLPYFALEFVGGGTLARRLDGVPQPAREAASMALTLARAMHFAHERGIIHRDLKPANVLLALDGTPKISEFGLAKSLEGSDGPTQTGDIMGTPSYMAPEQAGGVTKQIGPAADVYALGAILYELLTGRPPFRAENSLETVRQVMVEEPVPLRRLQPRVPRDLQTICLKCLEKSPHRRYPSAAALAEDLQRFLAGEPIQARPAGVGERLVKWARRRPAVAAVIGISTVALLVVLGLVTLSHVQLESANQKLEDKNEILEGQKKELEDGKRKKEELNKALKKSLADVKREKEHTIQNLRTTGNSFLDLSRFVDELLESLPQAEQARRAMMKHLLTRLEVFLKDQPTDPELRRIKAVAALEAGWIQEMLGQFVEAKDLFRLATDMFEKLKAQFPKNLDYQADLARAYNSMAGLLDKMEQPAEAERKYQQALWQLGKVSAASRQGEYRPQLGVFYNNLALLQERTPSRRLEARATHEQALKIRRQLVKDYTRETRFRYDLAVSHNNLGGCLLLLGLDHYKAGRPAEFRKAFQQAQKEWAESGKIVKQLAGPYARRLEYRRSEAGRLLNLGLLYYHGNKEKEAEQTLQKALPLWESLQADFPTVPEYRQKAATVLEYLGLLAFENDRRTLEVVAFMRRAAEIQGKLVEDFPEVNRFRHEYADLLYYLSQALFKAGKYYEAEAPMRRAVRLREDLVRRDPGPWIYTHYLGWALGELGMQLAYRASRLSGWSAPWMIFDRPQLGLVAAGAVRWEYNRLLAEAVLCLGQAQKRQRQARKLSPAGILITMKLKEHSRLLVLVRQMQGRIQDYLAAIQEFGEVAEDLASRAKSQPHYLLAAEDMCQCLQFIQAAWRINARDRTDRVEYYCKRAVHYLDQAVRTGFRDAASLQKDAKWKVLQNRADFRKLIATLRKDSKKDPD
jgi:serine/threonine-protein kinase